jgi:hypothetical protein
MFVNKKYVLGPRPVLGGLFQFYQINQKKSFLKQRQPLKPFWGNIKVEILNNDRRFVHF